MLQFQLQNESNKTFSYSALKHGSIDLVIKKKIHEEIVISHFHHQVNGSYFPFPSSGKWHVEK